MILQSNRICNPEGSFRYSASVPSGQFLPSRGTLSNTGTGPLMTRFELLHLLIAQAHTNGFDFRKWYTARLGLPWESARQSVETLCAERRYYALLFAHEFASSFWKNGERITFQVPTQTFTRRSRDGTIATVSRKAYTRRSARPDAWRYHLREMALAEEPLRYMRKYLNVDEDLNPGDEDQPTSAADRQPPPKPFERPTSGRIALVRNRLT